MNKKVDEEFKYIHDEYLLQCTCTEMKDKINNLQSNWNSLREYYKRKAEETKDSTSLYDQWTKYSSVVDKMNELEEVDNDK